MNNSRVRGLQVAAVVLFAATIALQIRIAPMRTKIIPGFDPGENKKTQLMLELPNQMLGAVAIGFKEAIAAVLWVRGDEFFHKGQYDAILPIVRMVTWLDPHQLDVYSTGGWHLAYNFTDSESRSDRRYIEPSIALLKEGVANNPEIYDLYFELGWTLYYQKIKDYKEAAVWIEKATKLPGRDPNTGKIGTRPSFVEHMLAHSLEQTGDYDKAEKIWRDLIAKSEETLKKNPKDGEAPNEIGVCKKNLCIHLLRRGFRYGDMDAYRRGLELGESFDKADVVMKKALVNARAQYEQMLAQGKRPHDVYPPIDVNMKVKHWKKKPGVLVVEGTADLIPAKAYQNLAVNTFTAPTGDQKKGWVNYVRMFVTLADKEYKPASTDSFNWDVDPSQTIMITVTQVHDGKFHIEIDMSKDRKQYPFAKDKYILTCLIDPRLLSEDVQDRVGWLGEGLTDKRYLDKTSVPGVNMIKYQVELDRKDIL
jgi:tetratricopeptide (TPR) repeat protein